MNLIKEIYLTLRERLNPPKPPLPLDPSSPTLLPTYSPRVVLNQSKEMEAAMLRDLADIRSASTAFLEDSVKKSEFNRRQLELIFNSLNDAVFLVNRHCLITAANYAARNALGLPSSRLLEKRLSEVLPDVYTPGDLCKEHDLYTAYVSSLGDVPVRTYAEWEQVHNSYLRTQPDTLLGKPRVFDYVRENGTHVKIQLHTDLVTWDPNAEDYGYLVVFKDITEQNQNSSEVSRLRSFADSLLHGTPTPTFQKDLALRFTEVNDPFMKLVNRSEPLLLGKTALHIFDTATAARLEELDKEALESFSTQDASLILRTLYGDVVDARVFSRAITLDGKATGLTGSILVTKVLDVKFRGSIFDAAARAVVFIDVVNTITGCNDEFLRMLRMDKDSVVGLFSSDPILQGILGNTVETVAYDIVVVAGRSVNRMRSPMFDAQGKYEGMICVYFVNLIQDN